MSGQPVKTQSDVNKFRNEYLETLALQESINDMNLQANKTYLLTGQLPPQSQMQDTRTTAEKLADVEKLKQEIASNLAPIAEPQLAYAIVSKVMDSPLNLDNSLLRFLAQRAPSLAEQIKRLMPYGIAGDANDIETIVNFIKNMYSEQQGKFQSTKSFLNSSSSYGSSKSSVITSNDLDSLILQVQDLMKNVILLANDEINANTLEKVFVILSRLKSIMPTSNQIKIMLSEMDDIESTVVMTDENLRGFYQILEKIPPYSEVMSLIKKIDMNINTGNKRLVKNGCDNLLKLFTGIDIPDNLYREYSQIKKYLSEKENIQNNIEMNKIYKVERDIDKNNEILSKAQKVYVINSESEPVWVRNAVNQPSDRNPIQTTTGNETKADAKGDGLIKRRVGRPRGSGMPKVIVPRIPNFVGFGVSEINQKSLAKGILSVRRNTRTNYPEMPSRRISDNMKNIVKTMIGGGVPKYEDLGKLDNDEKEYLHKLVSKSEMTDRLSVPAPSKDQQEKDIHNFEVLKGQILSGNDSQDLVKKFKLLIRKLSKQGLLPRGQVDDLLETLVILGY